jgi:hypothetical protein
VAPGDTLWTIAEAHYGDGGAWWRIVEANRRRLPDPSCIYACQRIYIPYAPRRGRDWPNGPRPPRDDEDPWARSLPPPPPPIEPVSARPRGCTDCGAGSHVSSRNGNDRDDDREWR